MSEVKTKTRKPRKKAEVKTPEVSLADAVCKTMNSVGDAIDVKMMFPRLHGETDEQYIKRFPHRAHSGDIGFDIVATDVEYDIVTDTYIYHTGIYCETKEGDGCFLMPRSKNAETECYLCNSVGLVETFMYRGEFCLKFKNRTSLRTRVSDAAIRKWLNMPWYKKMFSSYDEVWEDLLDTYWDEALKFAPYQKGKKIAQIVWMKFPVNVNIEIVDELTATERGTGGFGSTGE
jgi:dUTPase